MPEPTPESRTPSLSFRDLLEMLFRHRGLVLTVFLLVLGLTALLVLLTPSKYQSQMKILVQNNRGNNILSSEKMAAGVNDVTESQINSQIEILRSRDVLDPVADPGYSVQPGARHTREDVKRHEKLISDLDKHLGTEAVRKSQVITVMYEGDSPEAAQALLQRLSASFLTEQRRLLRPAGATEFFNSEADRYRNEWNTASREFVSFQQRNGLVSLPEQEEALEKQIVATQDQLRTLDTGLREVEGKIRGTRQSLADAPERQTTAVKTIPNQQSAEALTTLLVTLQNKRTVLLTQFKPQDRLVQEVDQQIAQTRFALSAAQAGTAQERTTDINPAWQQIRTAGLQNTIARESLLAQRSAVGHQLSDLQTRLSQSQALTVEYNLLKSRADSLKENYTLFVQKMEQAQIEDAMDERKLLNVTIAEQPTLPYLPVSPKPLTDLALGTISAAFLAMALLYFSELGRATIATPRELELATGRPVLATVPKFRYRDDALEGAPQHFISITRGEELREVLEARAKREEVTA